MPERPNTLRVRISNAALAHNFRTLQAVGTELMPVVKADAYGHGLLEAGRLFEMHGASSLGVGVVREGCLLRRAGVMCRIYALLGFQSREEAALCKADSITPVIFSREQIDMLSMLGPETLDIAIKVDTGMSRLGFSPEELPGVLEHLEKQPTLKPVLCMSHLATADTAPINPEHQKFMDTQKLAFDHALAMVREKFPEIRASLANSAACIGFPQLHYDVQRPGIALYGADPLKGTSRSLSIKNPDAVLIPAMEASAPVIQIRRLHAGRSISYGAAFTANKTMLVAVIAAGYGETYSRGLTGKASVTINGLRAPLLGRVCMQMSIADISHIPDVAVGQPAYLLGGPGQAVTPELLAEWWGTIPYEPLCVFGYSARKEHY